MFEKSYFAIISAMKNELIFEKERYVSSAFIDSSLKLGIAQTVLMIQDNLTECFNMLGCDGIVYREKFNVFWVFTKMRLKFFRRPSWREGIFAETFPVDNQGFKAHVNSVLKDKEQNILVCANQEACVLDLEKHRPVKITNLPYPKENFPESVFSENFERFPVQIEESDFKYEQKIYSQHIDMSYHMNNIEYIKLALNIFSNDFLLHNEVSSLEVHFTGESREGENLRVYSRNLDGSFFIFIKESERTVFEMKIEFQSSL